MARVGKPTMRLAALLLAPALLLAGCAQDGPAPSTGAPTAAAPTDAPWWDVGDSWDVEMTRGNGAKEAFRLVNFWNDSDTHHFWLGVPNRQQALDMALHDDNPLLGRVHWNILTPHESGIHAHGLYTFPVEAGDQFGGLAFGRDWSIDASRGDRPGQIVFEGDGDDRATIRYDYLPANEWFSFIEIKDRNGNVELRVDVKAHGAAAAGQYWFLRGRDYHYAENPGGTHDEAFDVKEEERPHASLALEVTGAVAGGPLRIDVLDPDGQIRHSETLTGGDVRKVTEIPAPKVGRWTIRYVGTGTLTGDVEAVGILEYTETV